MSEIPYSVRSSRGGATINNITGLNWNDVNNSEMIRKKDATTAEGAGIVVTDTNVGFDIKKMITFFNRAFPLNFSLGLIEHSYAGLLTLWQTHISPKSGHSGTTNGIFLQATQLVNKVKVGINNNTPAKELEVGTTLIVDDANKRVGINQATPSVDLEVLNTMYVNSNTRRVGVINSSPTTSLQVGTTLYVNDVTRRVGIGISNPEEDLEVDGSIQIDSANVSRLKFQKSGANPHAEAEIDGEPDGTNGGQIEFYTKVDGGAVTEKLRINNVGAIGIGGANYGAGNQVLTSNGSGSAVSWTSLPPSIFLLRVFGTTYFSGNNKPVNAGTPLTPVKDTGWTWTNFGSFTPGNLFSVTQPQSTIRIPRAGNYNVTFKVGTTTNIGITEDFYYKLKYRQTSGTIVDIASSGITDNAGDYMRQNYSTISIVCEFAEGDELQGDVYIGGSSGYIRGNLPTDILVKKMTYMSIHNVD